MPPVTTRLSRSQRLAYAAGSFGTGGFATVPGLLLLFYLTDTLGVRADVAGAIALAPKLVDVVLNPVLGSLSDRSMQRHGSRRPWLLAGALALPLAFAATFAVPAGLGRAAAAGWVAVAFGASVVAFAVFQVSYLVLAAEITDDEAERTDLMAWRIAALSLAILVFGAGAPALVDGAGGGRSGYLVMAVVAAVALAAAMLTTWRGSRGFGHWAAAVREPTVRERVRAVAENRTFRVLLGAFVLQALATGMMLAALAYVARYLLGSTAATSVLFVCFIAPALLVMPLWRRVAARRGKRFGYLAATSVFLVATLALTAVRSLPAAGVYLVVGLVGVAYAGLQLFPLSMLPDVLAADAVAAGQQRAGVLTGVWTAAETAGLALGPGLVGLGLAAGGFVPSADDVVVTQPSSALTAVVVVFAVVPALLALLSLPLVRRYDLDPAAVPAAARKVDV
jgi:Na+/melibiose symporter-like transporter